MLATRSAAHDIEHFQRDILMLQLRHRPTETH